LLELARDFSDKATTAYCEGKIGKAFALIHVATIHLGNIERILT
ncbi:unnamed protein product, partial [marine sediment metagenome]